MKSQLEDKSDLEQQLHSANEERSHMVSINLEFSSLIRELCLSGISEELRAFSNLVILGSHLISIPNYTKGLFLENLCGAPSVPQ